MATRLFERVVKASDTAQFQFAGNAAGETWTPHLFEVATDGTVVELQAALNLSAGSAIANSKYYKVSVAPAAMTAGRTYFVEMIREGDNASIRLPAYAYDPADDIGVASDGTDKATVFGKIAKARSDIGGDITTLSNKIGPMGANNLQSLAAVLGVGGFEAANKSLHSYLTDGTFGLSQLRTQLDELSKDLNNEVATSFNGVTGTVDTTAKALRKIYDAVDQVEGWVDNAESKSDDVLGRLGGSGAAMSFTAPILSGIVDVQGALNALGSEMGDTSGGDWGTKDGAAITAPATQAAALAKIYKDTMFAFGDIRGLVDQVEGYTDALEGLIGTSALTVNGTVFGDIEKVYNRIGSVSSISNGNTVAQDLKALYDVLKTANTGMEAVLTAVKTEQGKLAGANMPFQGITLNGVQVANQAEALKVIYDAVGNANSAVSDNVWQTEIIAESALGAGDAVDAKTALADMYNEINSATHGLAEIKQDTADIGLAIGTKPEGQDLFGLIGLPADNAAATTIFGRLAAMLDKADATNSGRNAALSLSMIPSISAPLSGSVAVKFGVKVTSPFTVQGVAGALEDPDTHATEGYRFAHVKAEGSDGKSWGARLFSDAAMTQGLVVRSHSEEPTQSAVAVDDKSGTPAAVEMWYRLARTSVGLYHCFVKVLAADGGAKDGSRVELTAQIRDSDPTDVPAVFSDSKPLSVLPLSLGSTIGSFH